MAAYSFSYTSLEYPPTDAFPSGYTARRPLIVGRLREPTQSKFVTCAMLVDSGADNCLFPASFLPLLGLDQIDLKMQMTSGVGSMANPTYYADVIIEIPVGAGTSLTTSVRAGFTVGMDSHGFGLLGQRGFFDHFAWRSTTPEGSFTSLRRVVARQDRSCFQRQRRHIRRQAQTPWTLRVPRQRSPAGFRSQTSRASRDSKSGRLESPNATPA